MVTPEAGREAAQRLWAGVGRRDFLRAVGAVGAGAGVAGVASACSSAGSSSQAPSATRLAILQPGQGDPAGDHYLQSTPDQVLWGYVPNVHAASVMQMASDACSISIR